MMASKPNTSGAAYLRNKNITEISVSIDRYGTVNSSNVLIAVESSRVADRLLETEEGMRLLTEVKSDKGISALDRAVTLHEDFAFKMITTPERRELLAESKDNDGWTALHRAVKHDTVYRALIRTAEGYDLLSKTVNNEGINVLYMSIIWRNYRKGSESRRY